MRKKLNTAIDILFESLYFLTITYVLSSMAISFTFDLFGLLCRVANIFAITQYYTSMKKHTGSHFWTWVLLAVSLLLFSALAWRVGYIKGEITPFARIF